MPVHYVEQLLEKGAIPDPTGYRGKAGHSPRVGADVRMSGRAGLQKPRSHVASSPVEHLGPVTT